MTLMQDVQGIFWRMRVDANAQGNLEHRARMGGPYHAHTTDRGKCALNSSFAPTVVFRLAHHVQHQILRQLVPAAKPWCRSSESEGRTSESDGRNQRRRVAMCVQCMRDIHFPTTTTSTTTVIITSTITIITFITTSLKLATPTIIEVDRCVCEG